MPTRDLFKLPKLRGPDPAPEGDDPPVEQPGANRAQTVQRLQVGLSGLAAMLLLVGLANIIQNRARMAEELSVPEAAPTVQPVGPPPLSDPLADAGVVPDLPAEPTATQQAAIVPEQGNSADDTTP